MLSALLICHDVDSIIDIDGDISVRTDSCNKAGLKSLSSCGVTRLFVAYSARSKGFEGYFRDVLLQNISFSDIHFFRISSHSLSAGDILIQSANYLLDGYSCFVVSWRSIPSEGDLKELMSHPEKCATVLVSLDSNPSLDHNIVYRKETMTMQVLDGKKDTEDIQYAACRGAFFIRQYDNIQLHTHPTTMISLLNHIVLSSPGSVLLCPCSGDSISSCRVSLLPQRDSLKRKLDDSSYSLYVDGALQSPIDTNEGFHFDIATNSVLRYCYGLVDDLGNVIQIENRATPREVYIPEGCSEISIRDRFCFPFIPHTVLRNSTRAILSLDHWHHQQSIRILDYSVDASSDVMIHMEDDLMICDFPSQLCEVIVYTSLGAVVISKEDFCSILNDLSEKHGDGTIVKSLPCSLSPDKIEFHVTICTPFNDPSLPSFNHQLLHTTAHSYQPIKSPLWLGHRGCGMNSEWKTSSFSEVENSLHGFNEARNRGLFGVEFDVQLSHDSEVMVFHDYTIPIDESSTQAAIASLTCNELKSLVLPAPKGYKGEEQHMPTLRELMTDTPADLMFNIEIKYPTVGELSMAQLQVNKNAYVDTILREVEKAQSSRTIYYSSFDLDVCLLLLHKQIRYPVFLLLDEESGFADVTKKQWMNGRWKEYVNSALKRGAFRGVVACTTLLNQQAVDWLHSMDLLVYCWGSDNNSAEKREWLSEAGVDAIIADRFS